MTTRSTSPRDGLSGPKPLPTGCEFDSYASDYDEVLNRALAISGENVQFFARGRIAHLAACLHELRINPACVLDYGCGKGGAAPLFFELLGARLVVGVDASRALLEVATRSNDPARTRFVLAEQFQPDGLCDMVFCNGVFHHIAPFKRSAALAEIFRALRPGGVFALWENNPWSLGARYVMKRVPFDADAVMLSAAECRRIVRAAGFQVLRTDFLFVFPSFLSWLRPVEPALSTLPVGAQYQVLCRKAAE